MSAVPAGERHGRAGARRATVEVPRGYARQAAVRGVTSAIGVPLPFVAVVVAFAGAPSAVVFGLVGLGMVAIVIARVLSSVRPPAGLPTVDLEPPVEGRWLIHHSPATKVPSHGTTTLGQAYAFDVVVDPQTEPAPDEAVGFCDPELLPSFGRPLHAPAAGTVVTVYDRARDHRCRRSGGGLAYLMLEGLVRELRGPKALLGNHVVVRLDTGAHAVLAHVRRGSAQVAPGDRVEAGQVLAQVGNSGNSSEPHLHFHVMHGARPLTSAGLPCRFPRLVTEERPLGLPVDGEVLEARA